MSAGEPVTQEEPRSSDSREVLQAALMSVYYHSLGRQLELRGAPTVLLPPPLEPARSERLESYGLADPRPWKLRYPAPLRSFSEKIDFDLRAYDATRARYRAQSSLFAAALTAYARGERKAFKALRKAQEDEEAFGEAVARHGALGGQSPQQYLEEIADGDQARIAGELGRLQDDVGLSLQSLVNDFADCMAFLEILGDRRDSRYRIFPTSAVVIQDSRNLTTSVTVTTLVQAESRRLITETLDLQKWQEASSDTAGGGSATLTFNPGGILVDQGYIKVRPLGNEKTWRVTVRKVLRFADRTPATWADTPLQFGQSTHRKRAEEAAGYG